MPEVYLHEVPGKSKATRTVDVVFVHGLGGGHIETWHPQGNPSLYWPSWIAEDAPWARVCALGYPAGATRWHDDASRMGLQDRARNILEYLRLQGIGERPIIFIAYSLGGLLVKQMLQMAHALGVPQWSGILSQTRAIAFIATPHAGSPISDFASNLAALVGPTQVTRDLAAGAPNLRYLSEWFTRTASSLGLVVEAYWETEPVRGKIIVVNAVSANPNVVGCAPIAVDANHFTISQPESRESLVYKGVLDLIRRISGPRPLRAYLAPGYTEEFRHLRTAISAVWVEYPVEFEEEDIVRLEFSINNGGFSDRFDNIFFIDFANHNFTPGKIPDLLNFIEHVRERGRSMARKPLFVAYSNPQELDKFFSSGALRASEARDLNRYFKLAPGGSSLAELQELRRRAEEEWATRPKSSPSRL